MRFALGVSSAVKPRKSPDIAGVEGVHILEGNEQLWLGSGAAVAKLRDIGQILPRLPSENSTSIVDVVSPGTR
jgi:propanediol utilization protein